MPEIERVNLDPAEAMKLAADEAAKNSQQPNGGEKKPAEGLPSDNDPSPPKNEEGRPEWLDKKFNSPEDLAKAYAELQKKLGGQQQQAPEKKADEQSPLKVPDSADVKAAADVVQKAGLDFVKLNETFAADGKLADGDYAALEKQGIPKAMVDAFISGQQALQKQRADATAKAAYEAAGNQERYVEAVQWAAKNLDKAEIAAFNNAIDTNDAAAVKLAVKGLMAARDAAGGSEPKNLATSEKAGSGGYNSLDQMRRDMADPRYETDPAYRAAVEAKLSRSSI